MQQILRNNEDTPNNQNRLRIKAQEPRIDDNNNEYKNIDEPNNFTSQAKSIEEVS